MTSKLIRDLKTLFHTYLFYREDDETNLHDWIDENVEYTDGGYVNKSRMEQNISVNFVAWSIHPHYRAGDLQVTVNPGVSGQSVNVAYVKSGSGETTTITLTTNANGYCYLSDFFYRNYTAHITVEPITVDGVTYTGGTATYDL